MAINPPEISDWLRNLQDKICNALEDTDGKSKFETDHWSREQGGGGITRIIRDGDVIEKGGVLFSAVEGPAPEFLAKELQHSIPVRFDQPRFYATGVSIVIHPHSPWVPIIHMNIRYFEMMSPEGTTITRWLGGGIDLTPHYIVEEDAAFFHTHLKIVCDRHDKSYYPKFKKWADDYFYIPHRHETRGIGGIFFDRLNEGSEIDFKKNVAFWKDVGEAFAPIYITLVDKNRNKAFTEDNKQWQLLRRGRYVEFNLIYDKGTKFGLETNGRVESILMSLPRLAGWEYDFKPKKNSAEEKTLALLQKSQDWI
jgi:coproporphyrinogen III oxidase